MSDEESVFSNSSGCQVMMMMDEAQKGIVERNVDEGSVTWTMTSQGNGCLDGWRCICEREWCC